MKIYNLVFLIFLSFLWSTPQKETITLQDVMGDWQVDSIQVGSEIKGSLSKIEKGENLTIKQNKEYLLNDKQQGIWKLTGDKSQIMFIKGKMEGLWQIEFSNQEKMVISITFDGNDMIKKRMVRLYLVNFNKKTKRLD